MKILRNFVVTGGLLRSNGDQAQVGDTVRLYPYEGESFLATIEAVAPVNCGADRAYAIEYDLDVVLRDCDLQDRGDVLDCCALLEERVEVLENRTNDDYLILQTYLSEIQTISTNTTTDILFDSLFTPGELDDNSLVVPKSGWYKVGLRVAFYDGVTASRVTATVKLPGLRNLLTSDVAATGGFPTLEVNGVIFFGKGDKVGADIYHNTGISRPLTPLTVDGNVGRVCSLMLALENAPVPPFSSKIIGVGDSTMEGAVSGADNVAIKFLSTNVVNLGLSSIKTSDLAGYVDDVIAEGSPTADLVFAIGINNALSPTIPVEQGADEIEAFVTAVRPYVRRVIWSPPTPVSNSGYPVDYETTYRAPLISEVISRNIPGLLIARTDLDPTIGAIGRSNIMSLYPDQVHPSALGQYYISKVIEPLLA